ncbi:hypothetical protein KI387_038576, partial [Taxus chinensis]
FSETLLDPTFRLFKSELALDRFILDRSLSETHYFILSSWIGAPVGLRMGLSCYDVCASFFIKVLRLSQGHTTETPPNSTTDTAVILPHPDSDSASASPSDITVVVVDDDDPSDIAGISGVDHPAEISNQVKAVRKEKWNYLNCALGFMGVSLTFYAINFHSHSHFTRLILEMSLLLVCIIIGVLLFIVYHKIRDEEKLMLADTHINVEAVPDNPCQLLLFSLTACLATLLYISIAVNALVY